MKKLAPLTLITAALILAGCSSGASEAESEPAETTTEASPAESPTDRKQLSDYDEDERNFLADLADTRSTLTNEELVEAGVDACGKMMLSRLNRSAESDEMLEYTSRDVSDARSSFYAIFERDWDNADDVVRAATFNLCPDALDDFGYDAMRSSPFRDHFEDELETMLNE